MKLRDFTWGIRKSINGDRFETARTDDYCGIITPSDFGRDVAEIVDMIASFDGYGMEPETNCMLQYEEEGQICSYHWYLDDKYQVHARLFYNNSSEKAIANDELVLHCHREIRPDYDPIAHVRMKEYCKDCFLFIELCMIRTEILKYKE